MRPPWFPVPLDICKANLACNDFRAGDVLTPRDGRDHPHRQPQPSRRLHRLSRRMGRPCRRLITDTEHVPGELDGMCSA